MLAIDLLLLMCLRSVVPRLPVVPLICRCNQACAFDLQMQPSIVDIYGYVAAPMSRTIMLMSIRWACNNVSDLDLLGVQECIFGAVIGCVLLLI